MPVPNLFFAKGGGKLVVHKTVAVPPLKKKYISLRYAGSPNHRSEVVCLAARTLLLADLRPAFLRGVVIFVKYREVSTSTILPNSIDLSAEIALYSRFSGHNGRGS